MEKAILKRAFVLMIAAQLVAVACGDGGKKRRTPINKSGANAQKTTNTPGQKTPPGAPTTNPPGTGNDKTPPGGNSSLPDSPEEITKKSARIDQLSNEANKRLGVEGSGVKAQELEEGIYTLEEVLSEYSFQEGIEQVEALNVSSVNNAQITNSIVNEAVGLAANYVDSGRALSVPYKFHVQGMNGQPWQPNRDQSVAEALFKTALETKGTAVELKVGLTQGAEVRSDAVSIIDILGLKSGAQLGLIEKKEIAYQVMDEKNKSLHVRLRKGTDGKLRIVVTVLEEGTEGVVSDPNASQKRLARTMMFLYSREPLPAKKGNSEEIPIEKTKADEPQNVPVTVEI